MAKLGTQWVIVATIKTWQNNTEQTVNKWCLTSNHKLTKERNNCCIRYRCKSQIKSWLVCLIVTKYIWSFIFCLHKSPGVALLPIHWHYLDWMPKYKLIPLCSTVSINSLTYSLKAKPNMQPDQWKPKQSYQSQWRQCLKHLEHPTVYYWYNIRENHFHVISVKIK